MGPPLANTQYIAPVPSPSVANDQCANCRSSETTCENELDIPEDGVATADLTISVIADYVSKLTSAGAILPDEALGEYLRDIAGLPQEEAEAI